MDARIAAFTAGTGMIYGALRCLQCNASASNKCGKCHVARYCSDECQRKHWPNHRAACKIDRTAPAPDFEADVFKINSACSHGAPSSSSTAAQAARNLVLCVVPRIGSVTETLIELGSFVRANRSISKDPGVSQTLVSLALKSFLDNDGSLSRSFLLIDTFIDSFATHGDVFLDAVQACRLGEPAGPVLRELMAMLWSVGSRLQLIEALRARLSCCCLESGGPQSTRSEPEGTAPGPLP